MNTPVDFTTAKLLREKGFSEKTLQAYVHRGIEHQDPSYKGILTKDKLLCDISAPTIAEVVMWLYEKYGVWVCIDKAEGFDWWKFNIRKLKDVGYEYGGFGCDFNSPTEACDAGIEYALKNLI